MHTTEFLREQRAMYLQRLKHLHQLADVLQTDPTLLAAQLYRLKRMNESKAGDTNLYERNKK